MKKIQIFHKVAMRYRPVNNQTEVSNTVILVMNMEEIMSINLMLQIKNIIKETLNQKKKFMKVQAININRNPTHKL